ncbi:MAG TPA: hypothetical protein VMH90_07355, partial [Thermoplasmata archaeon]|nr:hypothetical protein [Thermoplasmata archaeon]
MTPDRAPRRQDRPPPTPPTREDLEGYLVGVRRRVGERRTAGTIDPALGAELRAAEASLRAGELAEADRRLRRLDARLDELTPEVEMTDRPRGLVGFRTVGDPGVPPGPEEDPLANRLVLVGRLAAVRESQGRPVH